MNEYCPKHAGEMVPVINMALVPHVAKGGLVIHPHEYAVCADCYAEQWQDVYGDDFGGITYAAYLEGQEVARQGLGDLRLLTSNPIELALAE